MVKIMKTPIKMYDLGGKPHYFRKHPKWIRQKKNSKVERLLPEVKSAALELQPVAVPCIGTAGGWGVGPKVVRWKTCEKTHWDVDGT